MTTTARPFTARPFTAKPFTAKPFTATKPPTAPVWPETVYLDGAHTEVTFPQAKQASQIGCPARWQEIFLEMKRQGKFPYMYDKFVVCRDPCAVGMAFRNLMKHVFDGEVFDSFK